ncbi:hypothetical protein T492DRAFT_937898 [Pavlovales sp. CCMP2436]|nr:hypothetical protein T492DRAFT_937898 [Pavlovales sp. CCMP2436]|mmetsp:Transcript_25849/g.65587  ORF Transcript_25849/g.65587 Transcript_25849/m.65587 type:complete len:229 (+) Transcript_25849:189-875(+)
MMQCPWQNTLRPRSLESVKPRSVHALGRAYPRGSVQQSLMWQWSEQLGNITAAAPNCQRRLRDCEGIIVAKVVRIGDMLGQLHEAAKRTLTPTGRRLTVVHVIQDPRGLLPSRIRVGWGIPASKSWLHVGTWAGELCAATLRDMAVGVAMVARPRQFAYVRVLYEDLVRAPLHSAQRIYAALNRTVPPTVNAYFRATVLKIGGEVPEPMGVGNRQLRRLSTEKAWRSR